MVNLKNIFFFQKPFFKFYHRIKIGNFEGLSDRRCKTLENKWTSVYVSKYQGYIFLPKVDFFSQPSKIEG